MREKRDKHTWNSHQIIISYDFDRSLLIGPSGIANADDSTEDALAGEAENAVAFVEDFSDTDSYNSHRPWIIHSREGVPYSLHTEKNPLRMIAILGRTSANLILL